MKLEIVQPSVSEISNEKLDQMIEEHLILHDLLEEKRRRGLLKKIS